MTKKSLWLMRSYAFVDRDPECDRFTAMWEAEGIKDNDLAVLAGLAPATVKRMIGGQTRKPQHATFAKMAGAMGYRYGLSRDAAPDYGREIPIARQQYAQHKAALLRRRRRAKP